ncbi:MAG TPA: HlyD family efflux transporter periplasmic adaptor subunit [Candidatus Paceibacterota bacterium]|nr:HlyD family efflux transporter periplasmic adaptor subunit [Candidatus Paceibacterota bacterium]
MKTLLQKTKLWILSHKKIVILALVVIIGTGYGASKVLGSGTPATKYVLAAATRGTIISSVTGSGQVSAQNQVDVKAKASGEILSLPVQAGETVGEGALLASLDPGSAAYDLQTAKLSYDQLVTVDPDKLRSAQDSFSDAKQSLSDQELSDRATLEKAVTDLSDTMTSLDELYHKGDYLGAESFQNPDFDQNAHTLRDGAQQDWWTAENMLTALQAKSSSVNANTSDEEIESLLEQADTVAASVAEAAKSAKDAVAYARSRDEHNKTAADSAYTNAVSLSSTANGIESTLASAKKSLTDDKSAVVNAQDSLAEVQAGPDALDLRSADLSIQQKEEALADYTVRAPFGGLIAELDVKKGDTVTSGTTIATMITKQKVANISLSEIDIAKVKVGQKATLTFDALPDLSLTGTVAEVDPIGAVSQGVVSYSVQITFDAQDPRIQPGMSVTAAIVTDAKQDVVEVPISAVQTQGGTSYVEVPQGNVSNASGSALGGVALSIPPKRVMVTTGVSDDTSIEIISGLNAGEEYIARTIAASSAGSASKSSTSQSAPSLFGGGAGAATFRVGGGGAAFGRRGG